MPMTQPFRLRPCSPHCVGFTESLAVLPQNRPVRNRPANTPLSISSQLMLSVNKTYRRLDWHCLVENLLGWRTSVERLIRSIVVIMVSEPSQPAPSAGWTPPPERVKAIDPHRDGLKPLFDAVAFAVVELPAQLLTSECRQIPTGVDKKLGI